MKNNLIAFYGLRMLSSFWLIVPAMVPFYRSCGLGATELLSIQAVFIAVMLVMEIPSGYLADLLGRKTILIISAFMLPIGLVIYSFTCGLWGFIAAETFIALSFSLRSGADSAMLFDTLKHHGNDADYNKLEGRGMAIERVGDASGAILGGLAASVLLRLPFYINIGTACLLIPFAFVIKEPHRTEKPAGKKPLKETWEIVKYCINHPGIFPYIIFSAVIVRFGVIGVWAYFLYYTKIGINVKWFGVLHAAFAMVCALGAFSAHRIEKYTGEKPVIFASLLMIPSFALLGMFESIWMLPLILMNGFLMNVAAPVFLNRVNNRVGSKLRATAISFNNMVASFVFMVFSPLYGMAVDRLSLGKANLLLAASLAFFSFLSIVFIFKADKK